MARPYLAALALALALALAAIADATAAPAPPNSAAIVLGASPDPGFAATPDARRRIAAPRFDAAESTKALKAKYSRSLWARDALDGSAHRPGDAPFLLHRKRHRLPTAPASDEDGHNLDRRLLSGLFSTASNIIGSTADTLTNVVTALGTVLFDGKFGIAIASTSNEQSDNEWLTTLGIGTPVQTLQVVLDTGSPDTWVYSPTCCYSSDHNQFKPSLSATYSNRTLQNGNPVRAPRGTPGQSWSITYGNGYSSVYGYVGIDNLTLGDRSNPLNPALQAAEVPVALLTSISGQSRAGRDMEGLVGLSPGIATDTDGGWTTPMEKLITTGKVAAPYLSATLGRADRTTGTGGSGRYVFGAIDTAAIRAGQDVAWAAVTSTYYWGTNYEGMRMGSTDIVPSSTVRRIIIDTGSSLLNLPSAIAANANALIQGAWFDNRSGLWAVPCSTGDPTYEASLSTSSRTPSFWLNIAGSSFGVPPADLVFSPNTPLFPANATSSIDYCYSSIQVGPDAVSIVGGTFLKNHMVTFDWGPAPFRTRRMGFANRTDAVI